jgi:hypothetical protein
VRFSNLFPFMTHSNSYDADLSCFPPSTRFQTPVLKRSTNPTCPPTSAIFYFPIYPSLAEEAGLLLDEWFREEGALGFGDLHNQVRYLF